MNPNDPKPSPDDGTKLPDGGIERPELREAIEESLRPTRERLANNQTPSQAAMDAARKLRESLEINNSWFRPSQTEWETEYAHVIDRAIETERAELHCEIETLKGGVIKRNVLLIRERDVRRQLAEDMENLCVPYTKSKKNGLPSGVYVQRFRFEKAESALAASRVLDQEDTK